MKNKKDFDCVEMKRSSAAKIHTQISGMTKAQKLEYWRQWYEKMPASVAPEKRMASGIAETPDKVYGE
jgi:hypothetical protein